MDDLDKRIRRSAIKLVAVGLALGFLIGLAVGVYIGYSQGDRTIVVPLSQSIET